MIELRNQEELFDKTSGQQLFHPKTGRAPSNRNPEKVGKKLYDNAKVY
jgi:hypothetical protein